MKNLVNAIVQVLGSQYKVINSFNNDDEENLSGTISVGISNIEYLHHGNAKDKKISLHISGQFLTEEDLNQSKIMTMFEYIRNIIENTDLVEYVNNYIQSGSSSSGSANYGIAGAVITDASISSTGDVNSCLMSIDFFVCQD